MIRASNFSSQPFTGWIHTTTDADLPNRGTINGRRFYLGRRIGNVRELDIHVQLPSGARVDYDPGMAMAAALPDPVLPPNFMDLLGGPLLLNGEPMKLVNVETSGAGFAGHAIRRFGAFVVHVWIKWIPGQFWVTGECVIIASDQSVPGLVFTAPQLQLQFGTGINAIPGLPYGSPLLTVGDTFADGQGKAFPIFFIWPTATEMDWRSAIAYSAPGVRAVGVSKLWSDGNPSFPATFNARQWGNARLGEAVRRLHTWDVPVCGPAIRSPDTGQQEDQLFHPGGEALQPDGVGCELVRLLSALKLFAERPMNHLELDGAQLRLAQHPNLLFWDSRPHPSASVSPDRLGKPESLNEVNAHGRWGPDTQHFLCQTLMAAARLTGSMAAQFFLGNLARAYLLQRTAQPGWATSGTFSAREWGYECLFAVNIQDNLMDRDLAQTVRSRCISRMTGILFPSMAGRSSIYSFFNDPRLGTGEWVIAWQESFAAYGIDLASEKFNLSHGREIALRVAKKMMTDAWTNTTGDWLTRASIPIQGQPMPMEDGSFNTFGMPLCIATVLRNEPQNVRAREIWNRLVADNGPFAHCWLAPGLPR